MGDSNVLDLLRDDSPSVFNGSFLNMPGVSALSKYLKGVINYHQNRLYRNK
jgi:hypothetical protein